MMSDIVRDGSLQVRVRSDGKVLWIDDETGACVFRAFVHSGKVEIVDERLQSESVFGILSDELSGEQAISAIEALNSAGYIISRRERDE